MNDQRSALDRIHMVLKTYADVVKANVSSGRTDILIDAESIFCQLMNLIYDSNFSRPAQYARNFPAVDLIDRDRRAAVQITAANTRQKAQRTAESFLRHKLEADFDILYILILVYGPAFRNAGQLAGQMREEGVDLRILTLLDLVEDIAALPDGKADQIAAFLEDNIGSDEPEKPAAAPRAAAPAVNVDELPEVCRRVFRLATLLPQEGLEKTVFRHGLDIDQQHALVDLRNVGLLLEEGSTFRIHPHYQNHPAYEPEEKECEIFLDRLWNYEDSWQWDKVSWRGKTQVRRALAEIFAEAARILPDESGQYARASAELWRSIQNYEDALRLQQRALALLESGGGVSWDLARSLHFTGDCYLHLKKPDLALVDWKRTLALCRDPLGASSPDLAAAYQNVGRALMELKEYDAAEVFLLKGLKIMEALRRGKGAFLRIPWMETVYNSLATVFTALGRAYDASLCTRNALLAPAEQKDLWEVLVPLRLPLPEGLPEAEFVGRSQELAAMADKFEKGRIVCLSGSAGVGKTQLALRFARSYSQGAVYFLRFRESFSQTVALNVAPAMGAAKPENPEDACREAMDRLARCGEGDLLIIDDVDVDPRTDPFWQDLRQLPLRLLITTRYPIPGSIPLGAMGKEPLYQLFANQKLELTREEMSALIDGVDGHALLVDLIARTLRRNPSMTARDLMDILEMSHDPYGRFDEKTFRRLWDLLDLKKSAGAEEAFLRNMVLLPEDGMNLELLKAVLDPPERKALEGLIDRGWLSLNPRSRAVTIHPTLRRFCRLEMYPSDEDCAKFLDAVWFRHDRGTRHADTLRQYAQLYSNAAEILPDQAGNWSGRAAVFWNELGRVEDALRYQLQSVERREKKIPGTEPMAAAYSDLGSTYTLMGDRRKALEYQLKALRIREELLPAANPVLVESYNEVAMGYENQGDHQMALKYIRRALDACGKGHPTAPRSFDNAGTIYSSLGDYDKALEYQLQALHSRKMVLAGDDPDLALSYDHVGTAYSDLGDYPKALEYKLQALKIQQRTLAPDHPTLAVSFNNVGFVYGQLGDYGKALEYTMRALQIRETVLPSGHPDLAVSYNNLAGIYSALGDHGTALEYSERAMRIFERSLSRDHPSLASAYSNVGLNYGDLGHYDKAVEYLKKALSIFEKRLPAGHPNIENTRSGIKQYQMMGNMSAQGFRFDRSPLFPPKP